MNVYFIHRFIMTAGNPFDGPDSQDNAIHIEGDYQFPIELARAFYGSLECALIQQLVNAHLVIKQPNPLASTGGTYVEGQWENVGPIDIGQTRWTVQRFILQIQLNTQRRTYPVTFVRIVPPNDIKLALQGDKLDPKYRYATNQLAQIFAHAELGYLKLAEAENLQMTSPRKDSEWIPLPVVYAMLPHLNFDLIMPFVCIPKLQV